MNIENLKKELSDWSMHSIFTPDPNLLSANDWHTIEDLFIKDYQRYYSTPTIEINRIKYFPGLLVTLCYRIARQLFLMSNEIAALEFSSLGFSLTSIEIYYSSEIGEGLKINHGAGTVIGARSKIGKFNTLHHNVTLGDKNGGRPTLGDYVTVYPGATIVGDISIENHCIIGANCFVDKSFKAYSKIF